MSYIQQERDWAKQTVEMNQLLKLLPALDLAFSRVGGGGAAEGWRWWGREGARR